MKSFENVQMGSFIIEMQYLHDIVHRSEGMSFPFRYFAKLDVWLLFLNAFSCSLYRVTNRLSVCPTYALLQSGQVNLFIPGIEYLSLLGFLWDSRLPIVFVVRNAIFSCVFLNRFVT